MIGTVWLCDAPVDRVHPASVTSVGGRGDGFHERYPCPATSRAAQAEPTLRTVASRDGWVQLADGTHRCPVHAGAAT